MKRRAFGRFTFQYLDASDGSPLLSADVEFGYWRGKWHLSRFDHGCPDDCHFVTVYNEPVDDSGATLRLLRFVFFLPD